MNARKFHLKRKVIFSKDIVYFVIISLFLVLFSTSCFQEDKTIDKNDRPYFKHLLVDMNGPVDPWGKSVGDINGDGLPDLIVGGHEHRNLSLYERILRKLRIRRIEWPTNGELVWYENPGWHKHIISDKDRFRTDHEVADVDRDGHNDVVSLTDRGLVWFRNPNWSRTVIDNRKLHDVEIADFDDDGDIDIVARNQSGSNYNDGNQLHFYRQESPSKWMHFAIIVPHGEGLKVADMDEDAKPDVIVNDYWYKNIGVLDMEKPWPKQPYCPGWDWQDAFIDVADINADGKPDVVLSPAEAHGRRYHISWFEAPGEAGSDWRENIIDLDVEAVHHFIAARDMDNDDDVDIVTAEMHQGEDPDEISIYWNQGAGQQWKKQILATTGSHSMRVVDVDNDGDLDLFGANWSGDYQPVELWINKTFDWQRHVIDSEKPWRSVFVTAADLDGDGLKDIVSGGWWYKNPGKNSGKWKRRSIGDPANNMAAIYDFDGDGDEDILASQWRDNTEWSLNERILRKLHIGNHAVPVAGGFVWARNNGAGKFEILENIQKGEGDFLQGVALAQFTTGRIEVALSWHEADRGIQMLTIPDAPQEEEWKWRRVSSVSQDEQLSAGDIDRDGDNDLLLGTKWLRNDGDSWTVFSISDTHENPDRNRLVDLNQDDRMDAVVGFEAISKPGKVVWYEQGKDATASWIEHIIGKCIGPMSLDIADMDNDGNVDIVVGEHNLKNPKSAKLLIFKNPASDSEPWIRQMISLGDEHHDGAAVVDIDNDGDKDILSIGWGHNKVLLYENKCSRFNHL